MRTIKIRELQIEAFKPFGTYANFINPGTDTEKFGAAPIEFFRDMVQQDLGPAGAMSFSNCRVEKREMIIDVTEYHSSTAEGILPLDNDVLVHVGPASPSDGCVPVERFLVFRVPRGVMVILKPGVWHHAPFTTNDQPANVLIVLPERTYANDCEVFELEEKDRIKIEL